MDGQASKSLRLVEGLVRKAEILDNLNLAIAEWQGVELGHNLTPANSYAAV
jgi:hypothetical protein